MAGVDIKGFTRLKWYYQIAIVLGLCGALLGVAWYQFFSAMAEENKAKTEQLTKLQQEVAKGMQRQKELAQLKVKTEQYRKKLEDLKANLPLEKETDQILRSIYAEANASSVRILNVTVRPVIEHEVYAESPWDMNVVGTYTSVNEFFDKVRRLPRIVSVSKLQLTSRNSDGEKAFSESVSATYTATTYVYREEQPAAAPAAAAKPAK